MFVKGFFQMDSYNHTRSGPGWMPRKDNYDEIHGLMISGIGYSSIESGSDDSNVYTHYCETTRTRFLEPYVYRSYNPEGPCTLF
jgi:hypothetical protein